MLKFLSTQELLSHVEKDKKLISHYHNRYPVRLIFLSNFSSLREIIQELRMKGVYIIDLSLNDYLKDNPEGWFTVDKVVKLIKDNLKINDLLIVPFSELVRFFSKEDFISLFNQLLEMENAGDIPAERRIYIPLIGILERFKESIWNNYRRKEEWCPLWKLEGDVRNIKLYQLSFNTSKKIENINKEFLLVQNTKDWLSLYSSIEENSQIISCSKTLGLYYKNCLPDSVFNVEIVRNEKEFLHKVFDIDIPIPYIEQEVNFWKELLERIDFNVGFSFYDYAKDAFNTLSIKQEEILNLWFEADFEFKRWILKWYCLNIPEWENSYINWILTFTKEYSKIELLNLSWLKIFEGEDNLISWVEERLILLKNFYKEHEISTKEIEEKLKERFKNLENKNDLLTGITNYEKEIIIRNHDALKNKIEDLYPELSYYLSDIDFDNFDENKIWINEYFKEYKLSKINNVKSYKLNELLKEKNKNKESFFKWYYSFKEPEHFFPESEYYKLVCIDGLGVEFLSLLERLVEEEGYNIQKTFIARANLPTTTESNRYDNSEFIRDLDLYIHNKNTYDYPLDLIKEMEIVKQLVKDLVFDDNSRVVIVSDHGFTAFAISEFKNRKIYDFKDSEHEGRCMWLKEGIYGDDQDYFVYQDERNTDKKCLIALEHTSLYNTPKREVHGGATPEEVLVPVMLISKYEDVKLTEQFKILPETQEISLRKPVIRVSISPKPKIPPVLIYKGKERIFDYDIDEDKFFLKLEDVKTGSYEYCLKIQNSKFKIKVIVKGGISEREIL